MTSPHRRNAESALASARTHWGSGPDAGPTVAMIGVGWALLAIHDLLEERLAIQTDWHSFARAIVSDEPWEPRTPSPSEGPP